MFTGLLKTVLTKAVAASVVAVSGTGALAASGNLPAPLQDAAAAVGEVVGVEIEDSTGDTGEEDVVEDTEGLTLEDPTVTTDTAESETDVSDSLEEAEEESAEEESADSEDDATDEDGEEAAEADEVDGEDDESSHPDNHGKTVSDFAHSTELTGCERGQAIAAVARGDKAPDASKCQGEDADDETEEAADADDSDASADEDAETTEADSEAAEDEGTATEETDESDATEDDDAAEAEETDAEETDTTDAEAFSSETKKGNGKAVGKNR